MCRALSGICIEAMHHTLHTLHTYTLLPLLSPPPPHLSLVHPPCTHTYTLHTLLFPLLSLSSPLISPAYTLHVHPPCTLTHRLNSLCLFLSLTGNHSSSSSQTKLIPRINVVSWFVHDVLGSLEHTAGNSCILFLLVTSLSQSLLSV